MRARPLVLAAAVLFLIFHAQPCLAAVDQEESKINTRSLDLPEALADDDSFNELPFEQLRQALREEVERDPTKSRPKTSTQRYNLLIR